MCKARYCTNWTELSEQTMTQRNKGLCLGEPSPGGCPKFTRDADTGLPRSHPVDFHLSEVPQRKWLHFESLVDLWHDYYSSYWNTDAPRLMVRFEDTIFHLAQVMESIRQCVNGTYTNPNQTVAPIQESAKAHGAREKGGGKAGFLKILYRVASPSARIQDLEDLELEYTADFMKRWELFQKFGYAPPPRTASDTSNVDGTSSNQPLLESVVNDWFYHRVDGDDNSTST